VAALVRLQVSHVGAIARVDRQQNHVEISLVEARTQRRPQPYQAENRPSEEEERIKENNDVKVS